MIKTFNSAVTRATFALAASERLVSVLLDELTAIMLRRGKFRPVETKLLRAISALCFAAGLIGLLLGLERGNWMLVLFSLAALFLAAIYLAAAGRGRPL